MPGEANDAGASATTTTTEVTPSGAGAQGGTTTTIQAEADKPRPETSANKLIKDFAAQRGITVEAMLDRFAELENTGKTELHRLEGERDTFKTRSTELETRLRDVTASTAARDAAAKAGARSPRAVYALIRSDIEFNKQGEPTNIAELIEAAKTDEPGLFKAADGTADGGASGNNGTRDINSVFRQMAKGAR